MAERSASSLFKIALIVLGFLGGVEPSYALSPAEVAAEWGLLGSWRFDCSAPPSGSNSEITYAVRAGKLFFDRDFGDHRDSSPVTTAGVAQDGSIDIVIAMASISQKRRNVLHKSDDGSRYRTLISVNVETGVYSIKDGKFTEGGAPSRWVSRCR